MDEERLYTVAEVAAYLGVTRPAIYGAVKRGGLSFAPGTKCIPQSALGDYEARHHSSQHVPVERIDPLFWAWLAGFVDGEGCFHIGRYMNAERPTWQPTYTLMLIVANNDRRPLEEIAGTLQVGRVVVVQRGKASDRNTRQTFQYQVRGRHAQTVAGELRPYLRVKARQAEVFGVYPLPETGLFYPNGAVPDDIMEERARLYEEIRRLNHRGRGEYHPDADAPAA